MLRYRSADEDSARWEGFPFREGDIVVSTRSKHGTTWMQTVLLLLIHRVVPLPAPVGQLSPWLDHLVEPRGDVVARLEAQPHRRVIKTHTPLDGLPAGERATYVVVARHPLDAAVSLYHQGANIDRGRLSELTGSDLGSRPERPAADRWLADWATSSADPREQLDSLDGVLHHVRDAWHRRHESNVILAHFADLRSDLASEMSRLAARLDLEPPTSDLVRDATFQAMRDRATQHVPDTHGVLLDHAAFFRGGTSGEGEALLGEEDLATYRDRIRATLPRDLADWLHR